MTDNEYHQLVDALLLTIEQQIDEELDNGELDIDYESQSGVLEVIFPDNSKIVLNKQEPLQQLWVATKFNGHHFEYRDGLWIDNRSGVEFWDFINKAATRQANATINWTKPE